MEKSKAVDIILKTMQGNDISIESLKENVKTRICEDYCRYPRETKSDYEYDNMIDSICANCPLELL